MANVNGMLCTWPDFKSISNCLCLCVCFLAVTWAREHKAAPALPSLARRMGEGAREPGHGRRHLQVADGRRARRARIVHDDLRPRDAALQEHQQVQSEIQQQLQNAMKRWKWVRWLSGRDSAQGRKWTWRQLSKDNIVSDTSGGWRTSRPFLNSVFSCTRAHFPIRAKPWEENTLTSHCLVFSREII